MRSLPIGLVLLAILAVLQSTVLSQFQWGRGRPDLVALAVLVWSLVSDRNDALAWALGGGLFLDTLSGGPIGAITLALVFVSLLAGLTESRLWESHILLPLAAVAIGTVLYHLIYLAALTASGRQTAWIEALVAITLPTTVLNLVLTIPAYRGARWLADQLWRGDVAI
ncbi:MAG: rod shape-determining protein MreD [Anaerolineales bacterium]